ncbi:MAG: tRNA 4-thiouridine(8) synthase ThiI [Clostridiales bacterium]|nr:tRNA 4-thiouridine(8) synthase ThiI [Clostridiales bacterium]MCF8021633.1 tRNA 4-thiouridine(8) synthase ThiI [Clostridiales bacterium]
MVRYGEISLKGKNRPVFEKKLAGNIRYALRDLGRPRIKMLQGRMIMNAGNMDIQQVIDRLSRVFGIVSISPVHKVAAAVEAIYEEALNSIKQVLENKSSGDSLSFRVTVKRADKSFPVNSMDLSRDLGAYLLEHIPELSVDLHNPDTVVSVDIREGCAYIFSDTRHGPRGLPVGSSGRAVLMLSGGIDSPVAGWMSMKRGIELEAVHYHSFPFTGEKSKEKVLDLCRAMVCYGGKINLSVVHFTEIQKDIQKKCPEEFRVTIMRRFMFRIAQRIAEKKKALALVTGESVGQVASQTLESMNAIGSVTAMPVLRPLVGFDKEQITRLARQIGTYDISIQPYEDCCTLFLPRYPSTKPRVEKVQDAEKNLDVEDLVAGALEKTEEHSFSIS